MDDDNSGRPSFDSGVLAQGETFSFTFQDKGTEYYCTIHGADMQGTVAVDAGADKSGTVDVSMKNTSYNPANITVQPGTKVVWTNNDSLDHTVTSGNPSSGGGGY
ncbi:MAG: plastocyanin/azurin family copper-binding protein [Salinibacter sp.]